MSEAVKNIAIIGANKKGLSLLPYLVADKRSRVCIIADPNREAMLFKLEELGYRLNEKLGIRVTSNLDDVRRLRDLDVIIDTIQNSETETFLERPEFRDVEKLGPLSARLIWSVRAPVAARETKGAMGEQAALLSALREIVDAVRLTIDRKELLTVILKLALESIHADRGSIMLLSKEDSTLRVEIARGMDEEVVRKIRVPLGDGIAGRVAKEGKPLLITGRAREDEFNLLRVRTDVKSALCVPMAVDGEIIGVINANSNESTQAFTEADLNFLTNLASLAAEVIQRSNEYQRMKADAQKFAFWKEIDTIMSATAPLEKRLNVVCRNLSKIVAGLTCFIYIYDEDRARMVLKAANIKDVRALGPLSLAPGEGFEGWAMESAKDVVLLDRAQEGSIKRAYITLPMMAQGRLVGTLSGHVISTQGFTIYNESFLKDIRTVLAESLYKEIQREREQMRSQKLFAVDEAGLELLSMKDADKVMKIIASTPAAILGAEGAVLRVREDSTNLFKVRATYGLDDRTVRNYFMPFEKEAVTEVLRRKETIRREFSEEASPYIRGILAMPLMAAGRVAGVLTMFNKTGDGAFYPYGFSSVDVEVLSRFAVYAEKALSNLLDIKKEARPRHGGEAPDVSAGMHTMEFFKRRVEEELNRARRLDKRFVLATVTLKGLKDLEVDNREEFTARLIEAIRRRIRNFDVVAVIDDERFGLLFPDTEEKVSRMLEGIADTLSSDDAINRAFVGGRVQINYGYATFPEDGDSFRELFSKALDNRRLNLNRTH